VIDKLVEAEKYFSGTNYQEVTDHAARLLLAGKEDSAAEYMKMYLPTVEMMFGRLLEKLRGKAVYKTLDLIERGKTQNNFQKLKGFSSLMTHICVECDKGHGEYRILLPYVYERISELIYQVSAQRVAAPNRLG
jgi:hypothetical protein